MSTPTTDQAAIRQAIRALRNDGWELASVWDGGERIRARTEAQALDAIMAVDTALLLVKRSPDEAGTVMFVMGNDPEEVIADHTVNLSPTLDPLMDRWTD